MVKLLAWLFAAGKLGKVLSTGGTMLISVFAYGLLYGWRFALGFVLLLFLHEMGHFIAARNKGIEAGLPMFIPFVGAWTTLKHDAPRTAQLDAYIGFAGPLAGTLAAMGCYWIARSTDSQLMLALAYVGFLLNLINMIPAPVLDGGHITAAISPKLWLIGLPLLVALFIYTLNPVLLLVGFFAIPQFIAALKNDPEASGLPPDYYNVPAGVRMSYGMLYLGLSAFLASMSYGVYNSLSPAAQG